MAQQQMNIDLNNTTPIICENCGNETFRPIFFLRKISRFLSPDGNERVVPIDSLACLECNHVNKDFKPIPLEENNTKQNEQKED
jgi:hypothetical protein